MLKLPFIEKTYVGVEITTECVRWVEVNKIGRNVRLQTYGEVAIQDGISGVLEGLKSKLKNDAYFLGCANSAILNELFQEDAPLFEEEPEFEDWLINYKKKLESSVHQSEVKTGVHVVQLDEDVRKILLQSVSKEKINSILSLFNEAKLPLIYITSGLIDKGYSQIFNPEFFDGYAAVIFQADSVYWLVLYLNGAPIQWHELGSFDDQISVTQAADSILRTEELSFELVDESIPCFSKIDIEESQEGRTFQLIKPSTNNSKKILSEEYSVALGAAYKMCFPELDGFDFLDHHQKEAGWFKNDKTEIIRSAILLFAPFIIFILIAFTIEKWIEPSLNEISQVMELVKENLDEVAQQRERVIQLENEFEELSREYGSYYSTAPIFELIANTIPDHVWLNDVQLDEESEYLLVRLDGYALESGDTTKFLETVQSGSKIEQVQLLSTQQEVMSSSTEEVIRFVIQFKYEKS